MSGFHILNERIGNYLLSQASLIRKLVSTIERNKSGNNTIMSEKMSISRQDDLCPLLMTRVGPTLYIRSINSVYSEAKRVSLPWLTQFFKKNVRLYAFNKSTTSASTGFVFSFIVSFLISIRKIILCFQGKY